MISKKRVTRCRCTILALAILGLVAAMPMNANAQGTEGCQASASIPEVPTTGGDCGSHLAVNQEKDINIFVQNTSTTVTTLTPVTAQLTGTITHIMACTTTACTTELPGTLEFVPGAQDGCQSHAVGVASCAALGLNRVIISMTATGVPLNATGPTPIATIRV